MEIQEMIREAKNLVSLPEVYYRVHEVLEDPYSDSGSLARVIETDTSLATRLLRIANSPLYGSSGRIDRISYAVTVLGSKTLRDLVLSTAVLRAFKNISTQLVDLSLFWHHSLHCGLAARELAKKKQLLHPERLLVAGIVHDVGQLLLYQMQPALSTEVLKRAEHDDDGLYQAEREVFGYTHADVGAELLKSWRLPISLQEMVAYHHEPEHSEAFALESALLHLGNFIANRIEPARMIEDSLEPHCSSEAWVITGLDEQVIDPVLDKTNEMFLEVLDVLMPGQRVKR